jgi:hypothetical protein
MFIAARCIQFACANGAGHTVPRRPGLRTWDVLGRPTGTLKGSQRLPTYLTGTPSQRD